MLDNFDREVLNDSGYAPDLLKQYYGADLAEHSAKKYIAGIRLHLRHKESMMPENTSNNEMEEVVIKSDGSRTTKRMVLLSETDKMNPKRVMELMGYDPLQWELVSCKTRRNYWDVTMKLKKHSSDGEAYDEPHKETNHAYLVTLTVKPIQQMITTKVVEEVFKDLKKPKFEKRNYQYSDLMLELPMLDVHIGKTPWDDNLNIDTSIEVYKKVVLEIISKTKQANLKFEKIVFPIGQDFFHFDTVKGTTTSGTMVNGSTKWQNMYSKGVNLLVWTITQLSELAPVESMYVPGNHDEMLSYCATQTIAAYFHDCNYVTVDTSPNPRKYIHYGKVLIGNSHGREEGKRIYSLMQIEEPEAWAESVYREWHLGDIHHLSTNEDSGVVVRHLSTICAPDEWHNKKGFCGAIKKATAFVWGKNTGEEFTITVNA